jgi:hypothetical protein
MFNELDATSLLPTGLYLPRWPVGLMELVCTLPLWLVLANWWGMQLYKLYIDAGLVWGTWFWLLVEKVDLLELVCTLVLWPFITFWNSAFRCSVDEQDVSWCIASWLLIEKADVTTFLPMPSLLRAGSMELVELARMPLLWLVKWMDTIVEEKGLLKEARSVNEEGLNWLAAFWLMFEEI